MASLGEINILIGLKGADKVVDDFESINKRMKKFSTELNGFARDLSNVGKSIQRSGALITGAFSAAFIAARKDIPAVDQELKKIQNSFLAMSDSIAQAALPTLKEFTKTLSGVANVFKFLSENNSPLLNTILKFSAFSVVIGTSIIAIAGLLKNIALLVSALRRLAFSVLPFIVANIVPITLALVALGAIFLLFEKQITDFAKKVKDAFEKGLEEPAKRATNAFEQFGAGFRENLKTLSENARTFGDSVRQSLENAFSDTLFDTITGRLKGLRAIVTSLGEDVLRAFTKMIANSAIEKLTKSFGGIFGIGGKGNINDEETKAKKKLNAETEKLTLNFKRLALAKDKVIEKFKELSGSGSGSALSASSSSVIGNTIAGIAPGALATATQFQQILGGIATASALVVQNMSGIGTEFVKSMLMVITSFTVAQAATFAIGTAFAIATAAVMVGVAGVIAAAWLPAALFASIATLGIAAGIGTAAMTTASGSLAGIGAIAKGTSDGAFGGSISIAPGALNGGEGIPKMAEGGIVRKPTLAMIGERGPEAVVPLNKSGGMGGSLTVNISGPTFLDDPGSVDRFVRKIRQGIIRMSDRRTGGTSIAL